MDVKRLGNELVIIDDEGTVTTIEIITGDDLVDLPDFGINEALLRAYAPELLDDENN